MISANWTALSIQRINKFKKNKRLYFQFTIVCEKYLLGNKIRPMETFCLQKSQYHYVRLLTHE